MGEKSVRTIWSEHEIEFLKINYLKMSNNELSLELNKTKKNIAKTLFYLGLKRDSESKKYILSSGNKKRGTDLTYELVAKTALKYETRGEFYQFSPVAYNKAVKENWLSEITKHMKIKTISLPQLILRSILEELLSEECSYNDRNVIKPYEIDCYFPKWKLGFEYDGKFYHKNQKIKKNDTKKDDLAKNLKITLLRINEDSKEFRNYEVNIKNQLKNMLDIINLKTKSNITEKNIDDVKINVKYPNLLSDLERSKITGKKLSAIRKDNLKLYKRIIKYDLIRDTGVIDDRKKYNKFETLSQYINYIKSKKYENWATLCKYEHPHRLCKNFNVNIDLIKSLI